MRGPGEDEEREERRRDIGDDWEEDDLVSRYRAAHAEVAEPDADWMAGG